MGQDDMTIQPRPPAWFTLLCAAALCAAGLIAGTATAQADAVGAVEIVKRNVYGKPPEGSEAPKYAGNPVAFKETIKTLVDSAALIRFVDGSKLTVGSKSVILLDEFVYDPGKSTGKALLSVTSGAIRFATGAMPKGNTTIVTPTATMVLRGTEVTVKVAPDGTTTLNVISGNVDTSANSANQKTTVTPGHSLRISHTGFSSGRGNSTPSQDTTDSNDLGGDTDTGDTVVDNGLGNGVNGGPGRDITDGSGPGTSGPGPSGGPTGSSGNHNAGSGHGNNGGL